MLQSDSLGITGGNGFEEEADSDVLQASVVDELDDDVNKPAGEEGAAQNGHENSNGSFVLRPFA